MNKKKFLEIVMPYTMTGEERIKALFDSLEHIRLNNIEGDLVECGVWKGGNILGMMEYLHFYKILDRNIWLYDTFDGMTDPQNIDIDYKNVKASDQNITCYCPLSDVKKILEKSKYSKDKLRYIIGDVNHTLNFKENLPTKISLLRLDTDWYKSTKKELEILYPLLVDKGVLIIDDYGHWNGAKVAVNEYFNNLIPDYIDYTAIKIIKNI